MTDRLPRLLKDSRLAMTKGKQGRFGEMRKFHLRIPVYIPEIFYRLAVRLVLIYRRLRYGYTFRRIALSQGKYAIVDVDKHEELNKFKWYTAKNQQIWYAMRSERIENHYQRHTTILMHRQIMNLPKDKLIDHINHNGLDNRRANLRVVSAEQNNWNRRKQRGQCTSPYKGVFHRYGKWSAVIKCKGKQISIGWFEDEEAAARAYDEKAKELFGQYACLNFP